MIGLVQLLIGFVVAGIQWLLGIIFLAILVKVFFGGSGSSATTTHRKKPFFVADARDHVGSARKHVPDARDNIPDARDRVSHAVKNERDRRRW
ncbi:hypothetical protein D1831_14395 [Lactiplantibacillus garii]|uniref:Uncharacterized protein n=2 Tax=Lactiplantibacillus garii TaxID=2306423 RepID=A0A3R8QNX5_9LACO|nr:hypothetical protein D1831_14395 [Lactiplantibacillus garii]